MLSRRQLLSQASTAGVADFVAVGVSKASQTVRPLENPSFEDGLRGWSEEFLESPEQAPGDVSATSRDGGAARMFVCGQPSTVLLTQEFKTSVPENHSFEVNIETGGDLDCCGGFGVYIGDRKAENISHPADGPHRLVVQTEERRPRGTEFRLRTSIWPGCGHTIVKSVETDSIEVSSGAANSRNEQEPGGTGGGLPLSPLGAVGGILFVGYLLVSALSGSSSSSGTSSKSTSSSGASSSSPSPSSSSTSGDTAVYSSTSSAGGTAGAGTNRSPSKTSATTTSSSRPTRNSSSSTGTNTRVYSSSTCSNCGETLDNAIKYCPECGRRVK